MAIWLKVAEQLPKQRKTTILRIAYNTDIVYKKSLLAHYLYLVFTYRNDAEF